MLRNLSPRRRQLLASTGAAVGALALAGTAAGFATVASAGPRHGGGVRQPADEPRVRNRGLVRLDV